MHRSGAKASRIKQSHRSDREEIVAQYLAVTGQGGEAPELGSSAFKALFAAALRHMYACILQDMRPPWLALDFGQGRFAGLSYYTRPTFLEWPAESVPNVFGTEVAQVFRQLASSVGLAWAGIVARPLYMCTAQIPGATGKTELCMCLASMSPLIRTPNEHSAWLCKSCSQHRPDCPPEPRRILAMYSLVQVGDRDSTPLRSGKVTGLVYPPPAAFCWPNKTRAPDQPETGPTPLRAKSPKAGLSFQYCSEASDAIWLSAKAFNPLVILT